MKKILLTVIIFICAFTVAYSQCTVPTSVTITGPSIISICEGTLLTLSGNVLVPSASQSGNFTYSWSKKNPDNVLIPPTNIIIPANTSIDIPNYTGITGLSTDAGTYVLRVEDGNTGNSVCYTEATVVVKVITKLTITGTLSVCEGSTTQLIGSGTADATSPWVSATPAIATVGITGIVTGVSAGTSDITYTNSNGCTKTTTITVNPKPTITGDLIFCQGSTTQLIGSGIPSATTTVATISNTGIVTPPSCGQSTITYTTNNGCKQTVVVTVNCFPRISGTLQVCLGSTTQLIGSGTPDAIMPWTSATTAVAAVDNKGLVTGLAAGTSVIRYTNNMGCTMTATVTVSSSLTPSITINTNSGSTICTGMNATFTASPTNGGSTPTYVWNSSLQGLLASTTSYYTSSNLVNGEVITVSMTSSLSCATPSMASASQTIFVSPTVTPVVSITADKTTICSGTAVTFTATPTNGGTIPIYEWSINSVSQGSPSSNPTFTTTLLTSSFDVVRVTLITNATCASLSSATETMSITVSSGISAGTIGTDQTICYNSVPAALTELTAATGITASAIYTWEVSLDGATGPAFIPCSGKGYIFPPIGLTQDVYIRREVTDASLPAPCNTATSPYVHITVLPMMIAGIISADEIICSGAIPLSITQTTAPTGGTGTYTYRWESGFQSGGPYSNILNETNSTYSPGALTATTYYRRIETSGLCGSVSSNEVVKEVSNAIATIHIDDPGQTCEGDIVLFKSQATNVGLTPTYNWYVNNNLIVSLSSTATNSNLIQPFKSGDEVYAELISSSLCTNSGSVISNKVIVHLVPCTVSNSIYTTSNIDILMQQYVSNSIPNLTGYTYFWTITDVLSTGTTQSLAQAGIVLFPNPTADAFYIEMPESGLEVSYEILDITGLSVASGTFTSISGGQKIETNFGAGVYQVMLHYNNNVICGRLNKVQ